MGAVANRWPGLVSAGRLIGCLPSWPPAASDIQNPSSGLENGLQARSRQLWLLREVLAEMVRQFDAGREGCDYDSCHGLCLQLPDVAVETASVLPALVRITSTMPAVDMPELMGDRGQLLGWRVRAVELDVKANRYVLRLNLWPLAHGEALCDYRPGPAHASRETCTNGAVVTRTPSYLAFSTIQWNARSASGTSAVA